MQNYFQLIFGGQKNKEQEESIITEEFNVTNTFELNKELEKDQNLEYDYEDDEEEEEEDEKVDENGKKKEKNEKKLEEEKKIEKKNENGKGDVNNIINEKDIIKNENKNEEKKDDKLKEPVIEEIDTSLPKKDTKPVNENTEKVEEKEEMHSQNSVCHRIYPKGSDIDLNTKEYFRCYKIKTKSGIISFFTGAKEFKVPYVIYLDEHFLYMLKDKVVDQKNPNQRRIGNKYDLLSLSNLQTTKKGKDFEFGLEFTNDRDIFDRIYKILYFEPKEAEAFYDTLHEVLEENGMEVSENAENEDEEENEEEEDEEDEKKEKIQIKNGKGDDEEDEKDDGKKEEKLDEEIKDKNDKDINDKNINSISTKDEDKSNNIEIVSQQYSIIIILG